MPRKGRLVQPRHIFPWIAAPYIEMLRILWRIEGFFLLPIKYLKAWTVSAIFGVLGVFFSIALFIPRLTETQVQASPDPKPRMVISPYDLPALPDEQLVLPTTHGQSHLDIQFRPLTFLERFNQNESITTVSRPVHRPVPSNLWGNDLWQRYRDTGLSARELPVDSYIQIARPWRDVEAPLPIEYTYDPRSSGKQDLTTKAPTLHIEKVVPKLQAPHEPLISLIVVTNNGHEPVESAIVTEEVSDISRVIDCTPEAKWSARSKQLVWNLFDLQPQEARELKITIQPDGQHNITETTEIAFSSAPVIAETMIRERPVAPVEPVVPVKPKVVPEPVKRTPTPVGKPELVVRFEPPRVVKVGEEVEAYYTITNIGTADATGIRLLVEVPKTLRHRFGELVEHKISRLAPNESRRALFAALAEGAGRMPLNWTLEANDVANQSNSEWLAIMAAPAPVISTPPASTLSPPKSSIPAGRSTVPPDAGTIPPVRSSIPRNELASPDQPSSIPASESPAQDSSPSDSAPAAGPTPGLSPALSTDMPPADFGPRPLAEPSSIPSWVKPDLGEDPITPPDPMSTLPIEPELAPEPEIAPELVPELDTPILQPGEPDSFGSEPAESPSLPATPGDGTDVLKEQ
ncbi:MAG: hypothetical protein U0929_13425 [Planctomycetaceae bacterium]